MPAALPVDTIFLDAGGVLIYPNWHRVADMLRAHGIAAESDALLAMEPGAKRLMDESARHAGSADASRMLDFFGTVLDRAGVPAGETRDAAMADVRAYHATHNIWERSPAHVVPALEALKARGAKLVVASNANGVLHRCFDRLGLTPYFDVICDSFFEGVEKPDPRFFQRLLARAGSRAETTVHVGDLFHVDVVGARRAGLRAILLDEHDLYGDMDVARIRTLTELSDAIDNV
ncbi:MAG: HAD family hydrolase [Acidobacteria bacterium]|nr:HAD family hydrolase [Acidobacteriota bacterium]